MPCRQVTGFWRLQPSELRPDPLTIVVLSIPNSRAFLT